MADNIEHDIPGDEDGAGYLDYDCPADIMADSGLDDDDKRKLLEDWKVDLDSRLYAEAEGMSSSEPISANKEASLADLEQLVNETLEKLGQTTTATGRGRI